MNKHGLVICLLFMSMAMAFSANAQVDSSEKQKIVVPNNAIVVPASSVVCRIRPIYGLSTVVLYELRTTLESLIRIEIEMEPLDLNKPKDPKKAQQALEKLRAKAEELKTAGVCSFILDLFL